MKSFYRYPRFVRHKPQAIREQVVGNASAKTETIAAQIAELIKASNEDLSRSRIELFSFLGLLIFVAVTTSTITDRILLIGSRTKFPLLDVTIGIDQFLVISPFVVLAVHFALLLKFDQLRKRCVQIQSRLEELAGQGERERAQSLSLQVGTNFLAQWLVGYGRDTFYTRMNLAVYVLVLAVAPVFVLIMITVRTLPLHEEKWTLIQNVLLCLDIWLLVYLGVDPTTKKLWATTAALISLLVGSLLLCVPDSILDRIGIQLWSTPVPFGSKPAATHRRAFVPTAFLLENGLDEATRRPVFSVSRNLVVRDDRTLIAEALKDDVRSSPGAVREQATISLRGRDLRYAILDRSDLRGADFTLADLSGASLKGANLRRSTFGCAERHPEPFQELWRRLSRSKSIDAWPYDAACTQLTSVDFSGADLTEAEFTKFGFWRPSFKEAVLTGATLNFVNLSGADLNSVDLTGASLVAADLSKAGLIGASLAHTNLTAADLSQAELGLAALNNAVLNGANLYGARLVGAEMTESSLVAANLSHAILTGARLRKARLWLTDPPPTKSLAWADLGELNTTAPTLADMDRIKRSVDIVGGSPTPVALTFLRLKGVLDGEKPPVGFEGNPDVWRGWTAALSRSTADPAYQKAFSQIVSDLACSGPVYGMAILRWSDSWGDSTYGTFEPDALPAAPPDPSLSELKEPPTRSDFDYGWYDVTGTPLSPIPMWFDLKSLSEVLKSGKCVGSLPPEFVPALDRIIAERARQKTPG